MIIDTTYLLPLARIRIDVDLLRAVAEGKVELKLEDIVINSISIFELQAKAAKLNVPVDYVVEAVRVILKAFKIEDFHKPEIIRIANDLRGFIPDYVDCVIVATSISLKDNLLTEDSLLLSLKEEIEERYGIRIFKFNELMKKIGA
ncbi:MAG: PIN domain-containing protein [Candidatus Bathyarchaeia archaeon]